MYIFIIPSEFCILSGYFTFFTVVTVVASLNDYWRMLRLDVLFADPSEQANEPTKESADVEDVNENTEDKAMENTVEPVEPDPGTQL